MNTVPESANVPPVSRELDAAGEEARLWRDLFDTPSARARERLFAYYAPFARSLARRHYHARSGTDIEFADLQQLACTGLLEAIGRYDPTRGVPFRAYARRRISGCIVDGITKMSERREQIAFRNRVRRERMRSLLPEGEARAKSDPIETLVEIAVGLAIGFMLEDTCLYVAASGEATYNDAYDSLLWQQTVQRLAGEIERLPEREQAIVRCHYGEGMGFDEIGALLGLTKGRVSQLHRATLALLRKRLGASQQFSLKR